MKGKTNRKDFWSQAWRHRPIIPVNLEDEAGDLHIQEQSGLTNELKAQPAQHDKTPSKIQSS